MTGQDAATKELARVLVEYVCEWVEIAGRLEGKRGQRYLSFALIVDREGNQRPAYEAIVEGVQTRLDEFVSVPKWLV